MNRLRQKRPVATPHPLKVVRILLSRRSNQRFRMAGENRFPSLLSRLTTESALAHHVSRACIRPARLPCDRPIHADRIAVRPLPTPAEAHRQPRTKPHRLLDPPPTSAPLCPVHSRSQTSVSGPRLTQRSHSTFRS